MTLKPYFLAVALLAVGRLEAQLPSSRIRLNQVGFYPNAGKIAIVIGETATDDFFITSPDHNDTVYSGKLHEPIKSGNSSLVGQAADFSTFKIAGKYIIDVPGVGYSYPFTIRESVFSQVEKAVLKGYYYQRMSMPLLPQYAGQWARAEGHPDTVVFVHESAASKERPAGTTISTPGGWYDAGDYNKYIVNSGITMGTLLSAYEEYPRFFDTLQTNIPESSDKIPDIINEIVYNLRWMLTMQDPHDGGVYHKCTNAGFDGMIMPAEAVSRRYVVQKGTAATLDFAAVTAQAARVLEKFPKRYAGLRDSCKRAAVYAWHWAIVHPAIVYDQVAMNQKYSPPITTGAYGDSHFDDEWFWASCELYATTGQEQYYQVLSRHMEDSLILPSWSNLYLLGYYTLLRTREHNYHHQDDLKRIGARLLSFANTYLEHLEQNPFLTVMGKSQSDFIWGSNAVAMNESILLINAYNVSRQDQMIDAALGNLDYVLGRNATGYCFITGVGSKSPMHPHHRLSIAEGITEPVPGLLVGGPNPKRQDGCHYEFTEPETAYTDDDCAYASNEIAINWNAPLVYVLAAMETIHHDLIKSR